MTTVPSENHEDEIAHLAKEHGLTKTIAFIQSDSSKQRSAGSKRVAKHRQQKKEQGLVPIDVPVSVAQEIKAAGSFEEWIKKKYESYSEEKIRRIKEAIGVANKVYKLPRWKRWIIGL